MQERSRTTVGFPPGKDLLNSENQCRILDSIFLNWEKDFIGSFFRVLNFHAESRQKKIEVSFINLDYKKRQLAIIAMK